ncbi:hypothetical protein [Streptomyces malaysiensis]|uniref:hypothetical protein n=1 Tax=Streptomyces malaysiensis TaxID=92644 RepID=UPI0036BA12F2
MTALTDVDLIAQRVNDHMERAERGEQPPDTAERCLNWYATATGISTQEIRAALAARNWERI